MNNNSFFFENAKTASVGLVCFFFKKKQKQNVRTIDHLPLWTVFLESTAIIFSKLEAFYG